MDYSKIDKLDLSCVQQKLCLSFDEGGYDWPADAANEAIDDYKAYLKQVLKYRTEENQEQVPFPDRVVDIVWHTHILFTRKYHEDCCKIFGEYLHHEPDIK